MPIFIASPAQRCGTTLLQRLLSSAPNALIFGETVANDIHLFASLYQNKELMLNGPHNAWRDQQLKATLGGDVNDWIPDLMPDREEYLANFKETLTRYCSFYQAYVEKHGRQFWGCKMPAWPVLQLSFLLQQLPAAKVLYIERPVEECVVSARTINMCLDEQSTQQFRHFYAHNQTQARHQLPAERTLYVDYQALCDEPAKIIAELETFTGAHPIDKTVMGHKIANYAPLN